METHGIPVIPGECATAPSVAVLLAGSGKEMRSQGKLVDGWVEIFHWKYLISIFNQVDESNGKPAWVGLRLGKIADWRQQFLGPMAELPNTIKGFWQKLWWLWITKINIDHTMHLIIHDPEKPIKARRSKQWLKFLDSDFHWHSSRSVAFGTMKQQYDLLMIY